MIEVAEFHRAGRTEEQRNAVRQRRVDRLERRWWGRKFINLFLCWHLFALAMWLLPGDSVIVRNGLDIVRPYMRATSFAQNWNMFSPNPDRLDVYLEAEITYADGEKRTWAFPRMAKMKSYTQRYEEERWRKLVEVATHGGNHVLWPALARYAARVNNYDPQNRPVSVRLIQHIRQIPLLGQPIPAYQVEPLDTGHGPSDTPIRPEDLR